MASLLELRNVSKSYGSTQALVQADLSLKAGEVHALVGENGAGKSTALGLMYGVVQPDSGKILRAGKHVKIGSPAEAQALGIGCVFQELSLADGISVAENIFAGRPPCRWGVVDKARMNSEARDLLSSFDLDIDVRTQLGRLPVSTKQVIEIAKALAMQSRVLLLDEPTSALTPDEVEALHDLIRKLTARGIGVVYVSHHMPEIFRIADRVTVFRDGRTVSTRKIAETSEDDIVFDMTGGTVTGADSKARVAHGDAVLAVNDLQLSQAGPAISLSIAAGEIVGFAGLVGSKGGDYARAIAGVENYSSGTIMVEGRSIPKGRLGKARSAGVAYVPDERKSLGLFLDFSISDNLTSATMIRHSRAGFWNKSSALGRTNDAVRRFSVKTQSSQVPVGELSGGNQQKIMLAKWLELDPKVLIVNEPTKGVDIGAKRQIHNVLRAAAERGMAILVVSSDFPELLALSHRILVVRGGELAADLPVTNVDQSKLMALAGGKMIFKAEGSRDGAASN